MRTHLPHRARSPIPAWLTRRDVVVHRGLRSEILEEALVREAGSATRWCNPIGASLDVLRRDRLNALLEGAGVPVPAARVVEGWAQARELARSGFVLKSVDGRRGRGASVIVPDGAVVPSGAPFAGPYVVESFVAGDGVDRKLYVVGERVWLRLKRTGSWAANAVPDEGVAAEPGRELVDLARRVGAATGLEVYGADVLLGDDGPRVVDVNAFPGFRGVPDAAEAVARHVLVLVRRSRYSTSTGHEPSR